MRHSVVRQQWQSSSLLRCVCCPSAITASWPIIPSPICPPSTLLHPSPASTCTPGPNYPIKPAVQNATLFLLCWLIWLLSLNMCQVKSTCVLYSNGMLNTEQRMKNVQKSWYLTLSFLWYMSTLRYFNEFLTEYIYIYSPSLYFCQIKLNSSYEIFMVGTLWQITGTFF